MSIGSALIAGTAGLRANASAMAAVSDNIANVNTVGYKRLRNDFSSLLSSQINQTVHSASGVASSSQLLMEEQGSLQASSVATHMSISGNGFFVTRERAADATTGDNYNYTRAGQFLPDSNGFLKNTGNQFLYGWPVDTATQSITVAQNDLTQLEPVRVTGFSGIAEATSSISLNANLDASQVCFYRSNNTNNI